MNAGKLAKNIKRGIGRRRMHFKTRDCMGSGTETSSRMTNGRCWLTDRSLLLQDNAHCLIHSLRLRANEVDGLTQLGLKALDNAMDYLSIRGTVIDR